MAETGLTYEEIGGTIGRTRERIRQILKKVGITGSPRPALPGPQHNCGLAPDRQRVIEWPGTSPGSELGMPRRR